MKVIILGATGAVGSEAVKALVAHSDVSRVTALTRRALDFSHPKLATHIVDVFSPASFADHIAGHDAAICTFGVGQPSKVSREEFLKVDKRAVMDFADTCKTKGVKHFELLGSVAIDPKSRSFYLRSKGELRDAIAALGFLRFSCFQPSMLITPHNRYGWSQAILLALWPVLSPLLIGPLQYYRGIRVEVLGQAMAHNLLRPGTGVEILHWGKFEHLAHGAST